MTTTAKERRVGDLRRKLADLRKKIATSTAEVAAHRKKAFDRRQAASKSQSSTSVASKLKQADQHERKATSAEKTRGQLEQRAARLEADLVRAESDLERERARTSERQRKNDEQRVKSLERRLKEQQASTPPHVTWQADGASLQPDSTDWDFFISHASADKDAIVRPLAQSLRNGGARVWYDEFELRVGDDLRARIDDGLSKSRFGVVVLSGSFLAGRPWTEAELGGLFAKETRVLPIWHHVSRDEVAEYSPILAGRVALLTATKSLVEITDELLAMWADDD